MANMKKETKLASKYLPDLLMNNIKRNAQERKFGIHLKLKCKNAARQ